MNMIDGHLINEYIWNLQTNITMNMIYSHLINEYLNFFLSDQSICIQNLIKFI